MGVCVRELWVRLLDLHVLLAKGSVPLGVRLGGLGFGRAGGGLLAKVGRNSVSSPVARRFGRATFGGGAERSEAEGAVW